jgi:hypothetical protein
MAFSQVRNLTGAASAGRSTFLGAVGDCHRRATATDTQALWPAVTRAVLLGEADDAAVLAPVSDTARARARTAPATRVRRRGLAPVRAIDLIS